MKPEELLQAYKDCFNTTAGEKVLEDLSKRCYDNVTTFDKDPATIAYREGIRSVYLYIKTMLRKEKVCRTETAQDD